MTDAPPNRHREVNDGTEVSGSVRVQEFETAALRGKYPRWDRIPDDVQRKLLRDCEPIRSHESENTACVENHERIVDSLDASQPTPAPVRLIAVGRSSTTPQSSDRSLNDPVADVDVVGYDDSGTSIYVTCVMGADEGNVDTANGEALRETAAIGGGVDGETRYFLNHSLFGTPIDKNETITATVDIQLIYEPKP